jgi:hypothetical protein
VNREIHRQGAKFAKKEVNPAPNEALPFDPRKDVLSLQVWKPRRQSPA